MSSIEIEIPSDINTLDQNEEFFILKGEKDEKIQFHDYKRIYQTQGLYEAIFHQKLKCQSPTVIKDLLYQNMDQESKDDLKILDFGAGNGLVAKALSSEDPEIIVGVDIIEEAKSAALRDRGEIYTDYIVTDLAEAEDKVMEKLEGFDFNTLVTVAALGFDHIPPESFINAFNLIEKNGWIAFNIRDRFLTNEDESGFNDTLQWIENDFIEFVDEKNYVHRYSGSGDPINYTAMIGRKLTNIEVKATQESTLII